MCVLLLSEYVLFSSPFGFRVIRVFRGSNCTFQAESMTAPGLWRHLLADVGSGALIRLQKHHLGPALLLGGLGKTVEQIG